MTKIAVVGAGYWGPNLIRNFAANQRCSGILVCDSNEERLDMIQTRQPGVSTTSSFDEVLKSDAAGVVLATPVGTHHELAKRVIEAGKHVFVEKPLASSVAAAEDVVNAAAKAGVQLMVGHTFEYSPPVMKIKDIIDKGELGDIYFVSSMRVNLGLHQKDVSVIWDLAPHDFSILFSWLNEAPHKVTATGNAFVQKGIPDVAFISASFPSGIVAHIEVSWLAPSKLRRTTVVGAKKMLVYDDTDAQEKVKIFDRGVDYRDPETFGEFQLSYRTGDIVIPKLSTFEPLGLETEEFMAAIIDNKCPKSDGCSGLRVVRALEAAQTSLEKGGQPIEVTS